MNDFDALKKQWKSQISEPSRDKEKSVLEVRKKINKRQKKQILSNMFVSISFAFVFVVMGWVWSSFPDRTPAFYVSLILMAILLVGVLVGMWAGVMYKEPSPMESMQTYIKQYKKKLLIQKFMLERVMPVYMVSLLLCFYLYYYDLFKDASWEWIFGAYGGTTLFFMAMYFLSQKKKVRNLQSITDLISYLDTLENDDSVEYETD